MVGRDTYPKAALHGDGEVELSPGVQPLGDQDLLAQAAVLARLLGEQLVVQHLLRNVLGLLRPESVRTGQPHDSVSTGQPHDSVRTGQPHDSVRTGQPHDSVSPMTVSAP